MKEYLDLVRDVLQNGEERKDRTGVGTLSVFGRQIRYDLREGFPLVTTKKVFFRSIVRELIWFLKGSTNINDGLLPSKIWNEWADENGEVGKIYSYQWRKWGGSIDQISAAINQIKNNPTSRRIIVSAWNPTDLPEMALPPCHMMFHLYVSQGKFLDLQLYQRSGDIALGVPFNIASYSILLTMLAQECGLTPRHFIHTLGDAHVYSNHVEGLREQLQREPLVRPKLEVAAKPFDDIGVDDIRLSGYQHHPRIPFRVAV